MYVHKFINHDDVGHEGGDGEWAGKVKVLNTNSDKTLTLLDKLKKESQGLKRSEDEIKSSLSALVNKWSKYSNYVKNKIMHIKRYVITNVNII